jgi:hypothetical protein
MGWLTMRNFDVFGMTGDKFFETNKKAAKQDKKPIISSSLSFETRLDRFKANSFNEEETKALHEDALSI